jgi:flagellar motor switch protein FliN/FliY
MSCETVEPGIATSAGERANGPSNLNLVLDLELALSVRLGTGTITLGEALELGSGSVIELDQQAEAPVELCVNGHCVARGELVVVDGDLAVRVSEVDSRADRLRSLGRQGR